MSEPGPPAATASDRHVSPSLRRAGDKSPAFEIKFLLPDEQADCLQRQVVRALALDPHADPALGGAYRTATVYFDTPEWAMYGQAPGYRGRKYRLRRYGDAPQAFVERKRKRRDQVRKRRSSAALADLSRLETPAEIPWPGAWFGAETRALRLRPVCRVDYLRHAYFGAAEDSPVRVTFDRGLHAARAERPRFDGEASRPLGLGGVIVEFKFQGAMPGLLRHWVAEFRLEPTKASKYRRGIDALGLRRDEVAIRA